MNKNEILFYGFKPKRSYYSQIDSMMSQWMEWKKPISLDSFHYRVKLSKEDGLNFYQCEIEAIVHGKMWRGFECGKSVTLAVQSALKHARLQRHPFPYPKNEAKSA
jgi:hypothetical protein